MKNNKLMINLMLIFGTWLLSVSTYQRFECSKLTETELFMELPNNMIFKFKECADNKINNVNYGK